MGLADYVKKKLPAWPNWINLFLLRLNIFGDRVYGEAYRYTKAHIADISPEDKILNMVNFAIANVPYYRNKYGSLRIHSLKEFEEKIGFIDKDIVMSHWDEFLVDNIDWNKVIIGTTGGTSGKPLKLVIPKNRYIREYAISHKYSKLTGWKPGDCRAVIRNDRLPSSKDYLINPVLKDFIFDAFRMSTVYAKKVYGIIKKYNINYIWAYPSAVYQFFKLCEAQNLDLSVIKAVMLSSEAITNEQLWYITEHLGIMISCSYGHSEKLILAMNDCKSMELHVDPYYGYCEIVDGEGAAREESGYVGEMVGTTFSNEYQPLIRYKTGDYAEISNVSYDSNGLRQLKLKKIYGRWNKSLIYKKDGTTISTTALNLHGDFYNHIDGIQYIQEEIGKLKVLIIKNTNYSSKDEQFIMDHIGNAMGGLNYIEIKYVDKLILQPNGKFLPLVSTVN